MNKTTTTEKINYKGELFIKSTYNGVFILIRKKDGYINASKMGNETRRARKFVNSEKFDELCKMWLKYGSAPNSADRNETKISSKYELKYITNELKGTYIHPELVHFVAEWVNYEYAFTVSRIMDSINERAKLKNISDNENLNEIINKLNEENKELRDKITEQEKTIEEQEETIIEQEETIEEQANKLFDKSVRVNINNRKLTIHQEDGLIKISANNSRKFKDIITQYNFPASMNVKMSIKKEFKIKNLSDVPEEKLNDIINYLKGLQPKEIIQ